MLADHEVMTAPRDDVDETIAHRILDGFLEFRHDFKALTFQARDLFETRDWRGTREVAKRRLTVYDDAVERTRRWLADLSGPMGNPRDRWPSVKISYATRIADRSDEEIAETFFNSVTRKVAKLVGVKADLEFIWFDGELLPSGDDGPAYRSYYRTGTTELLVRKILTDYAFGVPYASLSRDAREVAEAIDRRTQRSWGRLVLDEIQIARPVFYRNNAAYLVGRIRRANRVIPLAIALQNERGGVVVDAILLTESDLSILFSLTRQYFLVDAPRPADLIGFLRSILPIKPIEDLYVALGFVKHGKTVRYRDLARHLMRSTERFILAPGKRGMVMSVFTLSGYDTVFKVIRDAFDAAKGSMSRSMVKDRYQLVIEHDRAGRLLDSQVFEQLTIPKDRFAQEVLDDLGQTCTKSVRIGESEVVFEHLYTQRRLYPLDLYVREVGLTRGLAAVDDYGHAIKDLAGANIFPGDLLLKNFGVNRRGRVVFYDYDEVCLLTECRFRNKPVPRDDDDDMMDEGALYVAPGDVFPEEFRAFLWPPGELRDAMDSLHPEIFEASFWRDMQKRLATGELVEVFAYPEKRRLKHRRRPASRINTAISKPDQV